VFNDIVIADMPENKVGCFLRKNFKEIFLKIFNEDDCPYVTAAY
jgi:hypothetical protein